jgi:hypothetical protein
LLPAEGLVRADALLPVEALVMWCPYIGHQARCALDGQSIAAPGTAVSGIPVQRRGKCPKCHNFASLDMISLSFGIPRYHAGVIARASADARAEGTCTCAWVAVRLGGEGVQVRGEHWSVGGPERGSP